MTLTQLRYLVGIVDAGLNITLAAERLHSTQPHLSRQLKQLEDELGFQLFVRRGRSLAQVAPSGGRVVEHARKALVEVSNIRALAANERVSQRGEMRLLTTHTQARFVLPAAVAALRDAFPDVGVQIESVTDLELSGGLAGRDADLAIMSSVSIPGGDGVAIPLYRWRRAVLVPRGHPLAFLARAPSLAELAQFALVSYDSLQREDSSLRLAFERLGLALRVAMTARDADLIKTYVRSGLGVGVLAEMAIEPGESDLVALPAPPELLECTTWALIPRSRVLRDYVLGFLRLLAPQLDPRDIRRVVEGNSAADWPEAPSWSSRCFVGREPPG